MVGMFQLLSQSLIKSKLLGWDGSSKSTELACNSQSILTMIVIIDSMDSMVGMDNMASIA
jgi:hypothetical protein